MRLDYVRYSHKLLAAGISAAAAAYALLLRPRLLRGGATPAEAAARLPADALVPRPRVQATHAITIPAPAARVWPWLVQMGQGRGGFYSHAWLENLFGLNIHNADRIIPELQHLKRGGRVAVSPAGLGPRVETLDPERALVLFGREERPRFACSWTFALTPVEHGATRLLERLRLDYPPGAANTLFFHLLLEPASCILERGMLLGIRQRAAA